MLMPMVSKNELPELARAVRGAESTVAPSKPNTGRIVRNCFAERKTLRSPYKLFGRIADGRRGWGQLP
jgi:hypothetical protein